ncbi:hypothetical protein ACFOVU_16445 [Nocardiopsis sediminis]|uniref:MFS transporter n=1 Tax=Nocardiopsis sediminis TaxID=1778267 RepID=A0ABV8FMZ6_9ACTN
MSPKKKNPRKPKAAAPAAGGPAAGAADHPPAPAPGGRTVSRTPVVLDDRRRWPVVVWIALTLVWALGSPLFFLLYLAEGFALLGQEEASASSLRVTGSYLLALLVCALVVPLAGTVAAAVLRRRIAAILFGVVLAGSGALLFTIAPPGEIAAALRGSFFG